MMMTKYNLPKQPHYHGFFSETAAPLYGVHIFHNENGEEVLTTAVYPTRELGELDYAFSDAVYVGVVYARGRTSSSNEKA